MTAGFRARVALAPEQGIGTVLLTNERSFAFHGGSGADLLFPLPPAGAWVEATVAPEVLAR